MKNKVIEEEKKLKQKEWFDKITAQQENRPKVEEVEVIEEVKEITEEKPVLIEEVVEVIEEVVEIPVS